MKRRFYSLAMLLLVGATFSLSSCLKDPRYVDFSKVGTIVEFPLGGTAYFGADAITEAPDTDANGTIVRRFAITVASPNTLATATKITLAIDNSIVDTYNSSQNSVTYLPMPANSFVFTATDVTIPAGQRSAIVSVTFYKNLLDPSKSYMLPIKIAGASGLNISGNMGIHYYHFIGNDFAGAYLQDFTRYNASDSTSAPINALSFTGQPAVFNPVTPTQFEVYSGYAGGIYRYEVSFTKTGNGAGALYSNFAVVINKDDVAAYEPPPNNIHLAQPAVFLSSAYDPSKSYTYTEALKLFRFQYIALSGANPRYIIDRYYKP